MSEGFTDDVLTSMHHETTKMLELVEQFSHELHQVLKVTGPIGNRYVLGEVMCSSESPLTNQVRQNGKSAFRFG